MNPFKILTLINLVILINLPLRGQLDTLLPDTSRWTSKEGISFQAVCYTNPKKVGDIEPGTEVLLRIYFLNTRPHAVSQMVTDTDGGFQLSALSASGNALTLHTKPPSSVSQFSLDPNKIRSAIYPLTKKEWDFLKGMPLTISTKIYDPTTKELLTLEAPIEIKSGK